MNLFEDLTLVQASSCGREEALQLCKNFSLLSLRVFQLLNVLLLAVSQLLHQRFRSRSLSFLLLQLCEVQFVGFPHLLLMLAMLAVFYRRLSTANLVSGPALFLHLLRLRLSNAFTHHPRLFLETMRYLASV